VILQICELRNAVLTEHALRFLKRFIEWNWDDISENETLENVLRDAFDQPLSIWSQILILKIHSIIFAKDFQFLKKFILHGRFKPLFNTFRISYPMIGKSGEAEGIICAILKVFRSMFIKECTNLVHILDQTLLQPLISLVIDSILSNDSEAVMRVGLHTFRAITLSNESSLRFAYNPRLFDKIAYLCQSKSESIRFQVFSILLNFSFLDKEEVERFVLPVALDISVVKERSSREIGILLQLLHNLILLGAEIAWKTLNSTLFDELLNLGNEMTFVNKRELFLSLVEVVREEDMGLVGLVMEKCPGFLEMGCEVLESLNPSDKTRIVTSFGIVKDWALSNNSLVYSVFEDVEFVVQFYQVLGTEEGSILYERAKQVFECCEGIFG
jgi:hypothetical protein